MDISLPRLLSTEFRHCASRFLPVWVLTGILGVAGAQAANILVVTGTDAPAITAGNHLNTDLSGSNTVTVVNTGVPVSLAGYTQIYDLRYDNNPNFSAGEMSQYLAFLNAAAGNTLFLMGENAAFNVRNTPVNSFITLAGGGTIAVPARTVNGPETVNPPFTGPNVISTLTYAACGLVTSAGTGAFASHETGGGCAIYFGLGTLQNALTGALVVVYDVNFIFSAPSGGSAVNETPFRLNLEQFSSSPTAPPTVTSIAPISGPATGGTPVTITGVGFTGATGVTIGGVAATSVVVVSDTSITAITSAGPTGLADVVVATPDGVNSDNTLYTYTGVSTTSQLPAFEMYLLQSTSLQVVQNEILMVSGTATVIADQSGLWQATTTTPWLTLNSTAGSFPAMLNMTANAAGLAVGTYNGTVSITSGWQTLAVPVTLTVLPPQSVTASAAGISLSSMYQQGSATGFNVQIGPTGAPFTVQTSATSSSWLSVSPISGVAGSTTIHVVIDPSKAGYGRYTDSIVITSPGAPNSPLSLPAVMAVSGLMPTLPEQVNSATGAGPDRTVAPNEMVTLSLTDFSCDSQPVVSINGTAVAWSTYAAGQINYAVPANMTQPAVLSVACDGNTVWSFNGLYLAATIPGISTVAGNGAGQAAAMNSDTTSNSAGNPAVRGSYVSVMGTGFGAFAATPQAGQSPMAGTVTAQVGGVDAEVEYAGRAPGATDGMQLITVTVPANSPVGAAVPVVLWVNGTPTQTTATIAVQ